MRNLELAQEQFMGRLDEIIAESQDRVLKCIDTEGLKKLTILLLTNAADMAEVASTIKDKRTRENQKAMALLLQNIAKKQLEQIEKLDVASKTVEATIETVSTTTVKATFEILLPVLLDKSEQKT